MAMHLKNNKIYILVAESDAIGDNRISFSDNTESETTNYCPVEKKGEDLEFYDMLGVRREDAEKLIEYRKGDSEFKNQHKEDHSALVQEASDQIANKQVFFNKAKLRKYHDKMTSKYKNKYSKLFKGNMNEFDDAYNRLNDCQNNTLCSNLFLTGERPYLQFADSTNWKDFKKLLYAEATTIVVECKADSFEVYPEAHALLLDIDDVDWNNNKTIHYEENEPPFPPFEKRNANNPNSLNTILYGAPGTGKTYATPEYALAFIENENYDHIHCKYAGKRNELLDEYNKYLSLQRVVFTTFHQNYGYEDFIQGLRPKTGSDSLVFEEKKGIFKQIVDNALNDPKNNYVIIIDEINRGNISKIFGELITLIEEDKRWGEDEAMYLHLTSGLPFTVPNNLYILGTMNSADKSIALIDTALRRRFKFIEKAPNEKEILDAQLKQVFHRLNNNIYESLNNSDMLVGHSYFIGKTYDEIKDIFNDHVIPLLYEYYFGDEEAIKEIINAALGEGSEFEIIDNQANDIIGRIRIGKK